MSLLCMEGHPGRSSPWVVLPEDLTLGLQPVAQGISLPDTTLPIELIRSSRDSLL